MRKSTFGATVDRGWAWIVLPACFCMNILNAGYIKCFGILFVEVEKEFHATASMTSLLMGVNAAFSSITALIVLNIVLERITIRTTTIFGVIILATGVFINSFATNIYVLIFSQGGLAGIGAAMLYGPGLVQVSKYFNKRRAMATAICSCGVSTGGMLLPPLVQYLITEYGLRGAFLIIAGMVLQILVFVSLYRPLPKGKTFEEVCKDQKDAKDVDCPSDNLQLSSQDEVEPMTSDDPKTEDDIDKGRDEEDYVTDVLNDDVCKNQTSSNRYDISVHGDDSDNVPRYHKPHMMHGSSEDEKFLDNQTQQMHKSNKRCSAMLTCVHKLNLSFFKKPLYLLIFGFTACGFLGVGLFQTFLPPLAKEKGLTQVQAALLLSLFNGLELVSRLVASFLAEIPFVKRNLLIALSMVLLGTLNQLTVYFTTFAWMIFYVALFGILNGIYPALHPAVIIDFVGMQDFSKVFGYVQVFHGAMMSACYPLMGVLRDQTGSYSASFHFLGACKLLSAVFLMLLPVAKTKMNQNNSKRT